MVISKYQDGITDITRTVHFGKPSAHEKACYTAVSVLSLIISICSFLFLLLYLMTNNC
uniref:Uncharacterized protein n=1 Tax=Nelumbo nucifera TaxID=4432 RepID=A0A822YFL0_NELNU|nr:TPA_asm: hypothetical protein HUJ06_011815 [Nelumbo nucifera]